MFFNFLMKRTYYILKEAQTLIYVRLFKFDNKITKKETEFRQVSNINKTKQANKKTHENTFVKEAPEG